MEGQETTGFLDRSGSRGRGFLSRHRNVLVGLCLALGALTSGGCAVAPALMLTTAAVSTAIITVVMAITIKVRCSPDFLRSCPNLWSCIQGSMDWVCKPLQPPGSYRVSSSRYTCHSGTTQQNIGGLPFPMNLAAI